jgi:AcrR family transcriptional regulator
VSDTSPISPAPDPGPETIWTRRDRGARGPQPEHSRSEIVAAAIALADGNGLTAVSMRAVAGALGTTAGSLYRYLSSRDDLLDLMVDAALAELQLGRQSAGNWLDDLVALAHQQLALYRRHPWLVPASRRSGSFGPNAIDYFEDCLRIMVPLSCGTARKLEAVAMMTGVVSLFARAAPTSQARVPLNPFANADPERHPNLSAALGEAAEVGVHEDLFERTVRSVLRGLLSGPPEHQLLHQRLEDGDDY